MPVLRVFRYLKFYPWNIAANLLFNMLAVVFNMLTFVMIVPFVELLFGTAQPPAALPPFSFDQQYLSLWLTYTLAHHKALYGLWRCLLTVADMVKKRLHGELMPPCDECAIRCTSPCNGAEADFHIDPSKL